MNSVPEMEYVTVHRLEASQDVSAQGGMGTSFSRGRNITESFHAVLSELMQTREARRFSPCVLAWRSDAGTLRDLRDLALEM